jgi:hypothetical protein
MKEVVWNRRISLFASLTALLLVGAMILSPGGSPGLLVVGVVSLLFAVAALLWMGRMAPGPSMAEVIHDLETEPKQAKKRVIL